MKVVYYEEKITKYNDREGLRAFCPGDYIGFPDTWAISRRDAEKKYGKKMVDHVRNYRLYGSAVVVGI